MGNKYGDISYKWLAERGFNVLADPHQHEYAKSLFAPKEDVQAVWVNAKSGTGKTTIATLIGAYGVLNGDYDKIIYIRNAVAVRDLGFLPGTQEAKEQPYMAPFIEALDYVQPGLYEKWACLDEEPSNCKPNNDKQIKKVFTMTSAYTRGITWDNAFIIFDEFQSFDLNEARTVLTRPKESCKLAIIGSTVQNDNPKNKIKGLTPFEIYMNHFEGRSSAHHELHRNYRGAFARWADEIEQTLATL